MKKIKLNKYIILIPIILLLAISNIVMYSSTDLGQKQLIFSFLTIGIILFIQKINIKWIINHSLLFYLINLFLLGIVLVVGKETNGAKAWLDFYYFKFQPSELMKITLLFYLINLNTKRKNILLLLLATFIPSVLTYLEPDTGAIIIYLIILSSVLLYSKLNKKHIFLLFLCTVVAALSLCILYFQYQDTFIKIFGTSIFYRIDRLTDFSAKNNIQITNALISIGAHNTLYFPEYHNDFVFAFILSKYPIFLTLFILICYAIIFWYLLKKKNPIYTATFFITLFQTFYNMLMNLGVVPIIGIPLPFLSYGGSYLISFSILFGSAINIYSKDNNYMGIHSKDKARKKDS